MTYKGDNVEKAEFLRRVGEHVRELREIAELTQERLALEALGHSRRNYIKNLEKGLNDTNAYNFVLLMFRLRDSAPDSPAVQFAVEMLGPKRQRAERAERALHLIDLYPLMCIFRLQAQATPNHPGVKLARWLLPS